MAVSTVSRSGVSEEEVLAIVNPVVANKADIDESTGYVSPTQLPPTSPQQAQGTYLEQGGRVVYLSTAYDFRVSPATYVIQGTRYSSILTDVALTAADATHDRFDAIVVNTSGVVTVVQGTPAANPASPDVDPLSQLTLSSILVTANSSTPEITNIPLYTENTEWTSSVSGGTINAASTSTPFAGTKCIEATNAASGNYVRLTTTPAISLATQKQLVLMLMAKAAFATQKSLRLTWYSGSTKIGQSAVISNGRYTFNHSITSYQQIVIPMADFAVPSSSTVDRLEILVNGSGANIGFRVDNIVLEPTSTSVETVLTLEGSQISGPYSTCGMTMSPNKILGRNTSSIGPVEELDIVDLIPQQDELLDDIADFVQTGTAILTYSSNGDTNGLFYFLGTSYNSVSWANPHTAGSITVVPKNTGASGADFVNRTTSSCIFQDGPGLPYLFVDIGAGRSLIPNKYVWGNQSCLGGGASYPPRSWQLQGTNFVSSNTTAGVEAATWTVLKTHLSDTTINSSGYFAFDVTGITDAYRYFRIIMHVTTGNSSTGGGNYVLPLDELELYGALTYNPTIASAGLVEFTGGASGVVQTAGFTTSVVTGNQDNFAHDNVGTIFMNNASTATFRGLVAGYAGKRISIVSIGAGTVVINHQDSNSTAANRIITSTGAAITLAAGTGRAELVYDTTNSRWRLWSIAASAALTQGDGLTVTDAGFRGVPQNSQSAAYTLVAADAGKHIYHPSADTTARIWTIPANASVAFPIGTVVTFVNDTSAGVLTIAITTDTMVMAGTGATGSRTLAANGVATAIKVTSTRWQINGTNLT